MRLQHVYLLLCVLGIIVPYAEFLPWLTEHGLHLDAFARELFSTRIGFFFGLDVVLSAVALFVFVFTERRVVAVRYFWLPIIATLLVGVSLGLPLFLYVRQRVLDGTSAV
jgi:hypothetical protein